MTTPSKAEQLRHAKLSGAAKAVQGATWQSPSLEAAERYREELPGLWEALDALDELLGHGEEGPQTKMRAPRVR